MAISGELSTEQRLRRVEQLLRSVEEAYSLTRRLNTEINLLRRGDGGGRVTPVVYSLGICQGDVETATNRLGGLRNELQVLAQRLACENSQA